MRQEKVVPEGFLMKLIDNRGRLFGKYNIIDVMVVLFILLVVIVGARFVLVQPEAEWTIVKVRAGNQPDYVADSLAVGDLLLGGEGNVIGNITELQILPDGGDNKNIVMKLNLNTETQDNKTLFNDNELKIGSSIGISTKKVTVKGTVTIAGFEGRKITKEELVDRTVQLEIRNARPWLADAVSEGASQRNSKNRVVAEVVEKNVEPAEVVFTTETGEVVKRDHPVNKDVTLGVRLTLEEREGGLYFQGRKVSISRSLKLELDSVEISGTITSISG